MATKTTSLHKANASQSLQAKWQKAADEEKAVVQKRADNFWRNVNVKKSKAPSAAGVAAKAKLKAKKKKKK